MPLKTYKVLLLTILSILSLNANGILSKEQLDSLKFAKEKAKQDSSKLKIDWINPITYTYSYSDDESLGITKQSTITISQPIFKSGGIYSAIKYSNNLKASSNLSIYLQKKALVKKALNIAYNIKKLELQIKKQTLNLDNANIDLRIKKEGVFNGLLDMSSLNNAIISRNKIKSTLVELEFQKKSLIYSFNNLSSKKIDEIELPTFTQIDIKDFEENHLEIRKTKVDIEAKNNSKWVTTAKYLPTVSVNYTKTLNHNTDKDNDTYGFKVVVPLDFKGYYDSGSAKVEYLKAKKDLEILKLKERNFFYTQNLKIAMIDKKIALTKENINSYKELLFQTIELANAGIKTSDDVKILENSKNIEILTLKILSIDKQIELLEIYGKIISDKI